MCAADYNKIHLGESAFAKAHNTREDVQEYERAVMFKIMFTSSIGKLVDFCQH